MYKNQYSHGHGHHHGARFPVLPFLAGLAVSPFLFGGWGYGPYYAPPYGPYYGPPYGPYYGPGYNPW